MAFPPEAFIIGAQKSGTSFLSTLLNQHPNITLSDPKEPDFFTQKQEKGIDWYKSIFPGPDTNIFLDASTSYTAARLPSYDGEECNGNPHLSGIPSRIYSLTPNAKLIYIVRNPIQRTYSSYWQSVKTGSEHRTFREAIERDSFYLRLGDYVGQLELYQEYFPIKNFLVILFEDFKADPISTAQTCFRFLGLEGKKDLELLSGRNKSFQYKSWMKNMNKSLANLGGTDSLIRIAKPLIPENARNMLEKLITKKIPPINSADEDFLKNHFKNKNLRLKEVFGIPIEKWRL